MALRIFPRSWEWGLLALLFLILRIGGLLFFHPAFNAPCPLEEYYRGAMAQSWMGGSFPDYWNSRPDHFAGGSLVMGILAAGFFKLFGSSAFVLKTIPVLISLGALLIWFGILAKEYSRKCAWYFALFWIFAPSTFQSWSLVPLGDHYETMLISAIAVWVFLKLQKFETRSTKSETNSKLEISNLKPVIHPVSNFGFRISDLQCRYFFAFTLGAVCGFGVWFAYIFTLTVTALLIIWFRRNPRFIFTPSFWMFALGFLIGFSPWIFLNLQTGFQGLMVHGTPLWSHLQPVLHPAFWLRFGWQASFLRDFFYYFSHPEAYFLTARTCASWVYMVLLFAPLAAFLWLGFRNQGDQKTFSINKVSYVSSYFIVYVVLHCLAVQLTDFTGNRFMAPLMPAVFFVWARGMEYLEQHSLRVKIVSRIFFAVPLLAFGFFLWSTLISPVHAGMLLHTSGCAYDYQVHRAAGGFDNRGLEPRVYVQSCQAFVKNIPTQEQPGFWKALSLRLAEIAVMRKDVSAAQEIRFLDPVYQAAFYFHFGRLFYEMHNQDLEKTLGVLRSKMPEAGPDYRLSELGAMTAWREKIPRQYPDIRPTFLRLQDRTAYVMGLGQSFVLNSYDQPLRGSRDLEEMKKNLTEEDRPFFYQGIGRLAELSSLFYPQPCETWGHDDLPEEKDPMIRGWMDEGREQIRSLVTSFTAFVKG